MRYSNFFGVTEYRHEKDSAYVFWCPWQQNWCPRDTPFRASHATGSLLAYKPPPPSRGAGGGRFVRGGLQATVAWNSNSKPCICHIEQSES